MFKYGHGAENVVILMLTSVGIRLIALSLNESGFAGIVYDSQSLILTQVNEERWGFNVLKVKQKCRKSHFRSFLSSVCGARNASHYLSNG